MWSIYTVLVTRNYTHQLKIYYIHNHYCGFKKGCSAKYYRSIGRFGRDVTQDLRHAVAR